MTRTIERHYCDICGKESPNRLKGKSYINNEDDRPDYRYVHYTEVCMDCCNKILDFIKSMREENED